MDPASRQPEDPAQPMEQEAQQVGAQSHFVPLVTSRAPVFRTDQGR